MKAPLTPAQIEALRLRAERARERTPLSELVGRDVVLIARGQEHVGLCPFHADSKVGSFKVNDGKEIFKCWSCGAAGDHFNYLQLRKGWGFMQALVELESDAGIDFRDASSDPKWEQRRRAKQAAIARDAETRRAKAEGMWLNSARLQGTPAESYLRGRGIDFAVLGRFPGAIRFRHDCWNGETGRKMAAMVTKMTALDGRHAAVHRTFLAMGPGGWGKAPLAEAKLTLGNFAGAHICLSKGEARTALKNVPEGTAVAISEGIEDGLSVALADPGLFVVAASSLDNIGGLALPPQVSDVVLIGQRDKAGSAADAGVERQIGRLQARGLSVACMWPEPQFKDFNDQLRGIAMAGVAA